jgi:hypothetical protein
MMSALQEAVAAKEESDRSHGGNSSGGDGDGDLEQGVDWGEAKRLLEEIAENDKINSMASTMRRVDEPDAKGDDEDVDYQYADDFEEYDDLDDEGTTMGGTNVTTASSTLKGEMIRQAGGGLDLSDGSATLRVENKEVDANKSTGFDAVSPSWKVKSIRNPHSNDKTLGAKNMITHDCSHSI